MSASRADAGKAGTTHVSFVCQRCYQPLKLDHSFSSVTTGSSALLQDLTAPVTTASPAAAAAEATVDLVACSKPPAAAAVEESGKSGVACKEITSTRLHGSEDSGGNGFTLLGETEPGYMENLSHRLMVTSCLFDVLSGHSYVDHPLCEECTDSLLDQLDQQLKITEDECKDYRDFLEKLSRTEEEVDEGALKQELKQLENDQMMLKQQLGSMQVEHQQLQVQMTEEKQKSVALDVEEDRYWQEYNEYKRQLLEYEDAQRSVDNQLRYAQAQLDRLKKTNVFNSTFHIWHSGHFGTINNFRLGRLPSVPVDWSEINAAWGQTVLLLHSLAKKMDLTFERYRLVPYGNHSFLESLTDKSKELPLYGSGGFRFFWDAKFDSAMVAFLDCLQQFKEEVEKGDSGFCLPYRMEKGKIEDANLGTSYSIKIQFNSEEQWTKALKFMLTNLKWGLAWVSSQFASK